MSLILDLPPALLERIEVEAAKRGLSTSGYVATTLEQSVPTLISSEKVTSLTYLVQVADDLLATLPDAEKDRLPSDGAIHLDHSLYGTPKEKLLLLCDFTPSR